MNSVKDQVWDRVWDQARIQVCDQAGNPVWIVWIQVWNQVRYKS